MPTFDPKFGSGPAAARSRPARPQRPDASPTDRADGRRAGRLRCSMMSANLGTTHGELVDVSATGARVLLRRNPDLKAGDSFMMDIDIATGPGGGIGVSCQVVWVRLNADKKFEMGIEFENIPEQSRKRLLDAVLHPTRSESLRRGWSVVGGIGVEGGDDDDSDNTDRA